MSAAVMKRNGGSSGHASAAAASNGNAKNYAVTATAATVLRKDPAALLARGYTARYLGAVLQAYNTKNGNNNPKIPSITALSNEEIERDLRHICAYQDAATRYHQLTYAATNHINLNAAAKNNANQDAQNADGTGNNLDPTTSSQFFARAALPVRIDPEEEKRRLTAQKRIQRAEAVREELEQQYVALRAHYVVTTQELQSFSQESEKTIETLQQCVTSTANVLAYERAKLQMTRDVAAAFQYRTNMIISREYGAPTTDVAPASTATSTDDVSMVMASQGSETNAEATSANTSEHQFPMLGAWNALEEEYKRLLSAGMNGTKGNTKGTKGKQAAASAATIIPWSCTMEPSTSYGIPLLLSALSTVPEKSVAVQTGNMFGSTNKHSLTWMESHLPSMIDDDGDDIVQTEADAIEALRSEVATLEKELLQERQLNQEILVKTGQSRIQHDEWVAMISLVRQETEAVLYRHNVLLESDEVRDAIANMATNAMTSSVEAVSSSTTMNMSHTHDDDEQEDDGEVEEDAENEDNHNVDNTNKDDDDTNAGGADAVGVTVSSDLSTEKVSGTAALLEEEGASEADDEGMEEEGEDVDDWDTTNNNNNNNNNNNTTTGSNKRSATATSVVSSTNANNTNEDSEGSPGGSRKRRKV